MNVILWVLQILLALHTVVGALWKFSHSEQSVPALIALPHGVWQALIGIELLCSLGLVLPAFSRSFAILVPIAAIGIAAEMLLFCGLHISSGDPARGELIYWLIVAAVCAFIAYGRLGPKPL